MKLAEMLVLDGAFKLSALEAKLRMEAGGGARQGLRLGGCGLYHLSVVYCCVALCSSSLCQSEDH